MYKKVRQLYMQSPILSPAKIADIMGIDEQSLKEFCISSGIASEEDFTYRQKFISFCLEGNKHVRCKLCGILASATYCEDCICRYKPKELYNPKLSWYRNMLCHSWLPTNKGWKNTKTGIFLPKKYQEFFILHKILP